MTPQDIIKQLSSIKKPTRFPKGALLEARAQWPDVYPYIEQLILKFDQTEKLSEAEENCLFFGIHLIADQKEYRAFEHLLMLCDRDDGFTSPLGQFLGDCITEDLLPYLFHLSQGRVDPLLDLLKSQKAGESVKLAALQCLLALLETQQVPFDVFTAELPALINIFEQQWQRQLLDYLARFCIQHQLDDTKVQILELLKAHKFECMYISESEIENWQLNSTFLLMDDPRFQSSMDVMRIAAWPAFSIPVPSFNNPSAKHKISRNDPCPCGSGKKYKKCCL